MRIKNRSYRTEVKKEKNSQQKQFYICEILETVIPRGISTHMSMYEAIDTIPVTVDSFNRFLAIGFLTGH